MIGDRAGRVWRFDTLTELLDTRGIDGIIGYAAHDSTDSDQDRFQYVFLWIDGLEDADPGEWIPLFGYPPNTHQLVDSQTATPLGSSLVEWRNDGSGFPILLNYLQPGNAGDSLVLISDDFGYGPVITTAWLPPNVKAAYSATFDGVNTLAAFDLFRQTIPAGTVGPNDAILVFVEGDYFNNSGATRGLTLLCSLGGTTIWSDVSAATVFTVSANHRPFRWLMQIQNEGATNAQRMAGDIRVGTGAGSVAGLGTIAGAPLIDNAIGGTSAKDMTANQELALTATHSTNSPNLELKGAVTVLVVGTGA